MRKFGMSGIEDPDKFLGNTPLMVFISLGSGIFSNITFW